MNLQQAERKWTDNTSNAGGRWRNGVQRAETNGAYCKGINELLGGNAPNCPMRQSHWQEGVNSVSPQQFDQAIQGKGTKWAEKYRAAFS